MRLPIRIPTHGDTSTNAMKSFFRNNGLSLVLLALFLTFWGGQVIVGRLEYNDEREERGQPEIGFAEYLRSSHCWEATGENWESEFLQMAAYVFLTVFLFQKGSSESKDPDEPDPEDQDPRTRRDQPGVPWPVRRGGWLLKLYENSLGLAFVILFLGAAALHAAGGTKLYNEEQLAKGQETVTFAEYFRTTRFWFESFQNWQSEFLAIASMVILSIFLRQRGSPESKPVAAPMDQTGD
jgi:hypothetical protein